MSEKREGEKYTIALPQNFAQKECACPKRGEERKKEGRRGEGGEEEGRRKEEEGRMKERERERGRKMHNRIAAKQRMRSPNPQTQISLIVT